MVVEGNGQVGATSAAVTSGQVAWLTPSDEAGTVPLTGAKTGPRVRLFAGQPLREPIAARGPLVMNTDEELNAGLAEFCAQGERFRL